MLPPGVAIRQCVLTLPFVLRFALAFDARLLSAVHRLNGFFCAHASNDFIDVLAYWPVTPQPSNIMNKIPPNELAALSARTVAHYDSVAVSFEAGTRSHDVTQNYAALLNAIEGSPPFTLLDFGCGPGRDLLYFRSLGHTAVGLDGSARFVEMAREASGCQVLHQNFLQLKLPQSHFHGVFANASMFHVPTQELAQVLAALRNALRPQGVLFCSNPRGNDNEGFSGDRYGAYHTLESWRCHVAAAGFVEIDHYYRPAGRPRHEQPWLATVWRKAM